MTTNYHHLPINMRANPRGFTVLFAVLIGSLLLAVGLSIFEITLKQVIFSTVARDSNYAIYAADTGTECALYWDFKCPSGICTQANGSAFPTSTTSFVPSSGVFCNTQDLAGGGVAWAIATDADSATTTFSLYFSPQPYCAEVTVEKWGTPVRTTITSRGYNTCVSGNPDRIERALQVNY